MTLPQSVRTSSQARVYGPRTFTASTGAKRRITAQVRWDDCCNNGYNSFGITADITEQEGNRWRWLMGGCCHEEVATHFPDLAHFIKWHLVGANGFDSNIRNAIYHAGERDHWGLLKGEPHKGEQHQQHVVFFGNSPMPHPIGKRLAAWMASNGNEDFQLQSCHHHTEPDSKTFTPHYAPADGEEWEDVKWHTAPWKSWDEAERWRLAIRDCTWRIETEPTLFGTGKERDLEAARACAIWPDATDADLTAPGLEARLKARIPQLALDLKADIESLGFVY